MPHVAAAPPPRPLEGVLVVSLEQAVAAPLATQRLAEAGARVIKVERPEGDFARGYDVAAKGVASYFAWLNQGKESVALDLRAPDDAALMARMVARADVFVQNLATGAADRLGLGAAALRAADPRLIACDISGFGADGPYATRKAYDLLVQAESGLVSVSGGPGEMGRVGVSVADIGAGITAFGAISAALVRQARTGLGAHVEVSLFDVLAEWMTVPLLHHDNLGQAPARVGLAHPSIAPYGAFATSDGRLILISVQSDREWGVLARDVLKRPELTEAEDFATNTARVRNRAATDGAVAEAFSALAFDAIREALDAARIAWGEVNDVAGLSRHPHLRRVAAEITSGAVEMPAAAARTDWAAPGRVPEINEHGTRIRAEFAP
ncbi:CoA transferase [Pikeienuella piscinae]|uniref:CoA transferase n=1 Tax=Pikeienuella piscinae TaxID=2748098 RepID=A0A7L5C1N4_9RHOB|nr:CaiB/BaiF CoA-transferase family protein [Pikeienuella piscinae]QIE57048.1 CoA transferase [Pikeienuella piscinae]